MSESSQVITAADLRNTYLRLEWSTITDPSKIAHGSGQCFRLADGTEIVWLRHHDGPVSIGIVDPADHDDTPTWAYYDDLG